MKYEESDYKLSPPSGRGEVVTDVQECESGLLTECRGYVATVNGYVRVYSSSRTKGGRKSHQYYSMTIIKSGREYHRYSRKFYTARGLVTKAKQFSADIFNNTRTHDNHEQSNQNQILHPRA